MERRQDAADRMVVAALTSALLLVLGQALTSRSVLAHLEAAVWLVPTWAVWVLAGAALVLRAGVLPGSAAVLAALHGLQHLGWAVPETAHRGVEGALAAVLLLALVQQATRTRRSTRAELHAYLREPLPPLTAPLRGAFAAHLAGVPAERLASTAASR